MDESKSQSLEAESPKTKGESDYYIMFLYKQKGRPTNKIELLRELTPGQYKELKGIGKLGKTYYTYQVSPAKKNKQTEDRPCSTYNINPGDTDRVFDKKLYKVTYSKYNLDVIYFLYTSEENYKSILSKLKSKKIDNSIIKIEEISFEDLIKKIKNENISSSGIDYIKKNTDIHALIDRKAKLLATEKKKDSSKKFVDTRR